MLQGQGGESQVKKGEGDLDRGYSVRKGKEVESMSSNP